MIIPKNKWHFDFVGDSNNKRQRFNSVELGRYKGVVREYYLKDNAASFDKNKDLTEEIRLADNSYNENDYYFDEVNEDEDTASEQDLYDAFDNPYIVQVAYELNRTDTDDINRRNLDDEGISQYVHEYILGNYYSNGFLALSAIGDFVLIIDSNKLLDSLKGMNATLPTLQCGCLMLQELVFPTTKTLFLLIDGSTHISQK